MGLERLQPANRIVQVWTTVGEVLGPPHQYERERQAMCGLGSGGHTLDRMLEVVDGLHRIAGCILDRGAYQSCHLTRHANRLCHLLRGVPVSVLKVARGR